VSPEAPPTGEVLFPRWLIIVRRDQNTLYESLVLAFKFNDRVDVLVDRREGEGRSIPRPIKSERRRRLTAKERALWKHVGFRVVYIAGDRTEPGPERATATRPRSQMGARPRTSS
jgi:hypothetical protein